MSVSRIVRIAISEDEMSILNSIAIVSDRNETNESHFAAKRNVNALMAKDPRILVRLADKVTDAYYDV